MTTFRLFVAVALGLTVGCTSTGGSGTLTQAPPRPSDYQPSNPLTERASGLLGRSVFRAPEGGAFRVELEDLLVQPSTSAVQVPLAQAAVIEVRSGEGEAVVGEKRVELKQGTTFTVSATERLSVQPRGGPVELRVAQIAAR